MNKISDVQIGELKESRFVQPKRINFKQDGKPRIWDAIFAYDAVAILIHNISRDVFVLVKQFRPAVYVTDAKRKGFLNDKGVIDDEKFPGDYGVTFELCAGLIDKKKSREEVAADEVYEECGYRVSPDKMEKIVTSLSGVGASAPEFTQFYVQVTDEMKTGKGGGLEEENELIELEEIPVKDSLEFARDESKLKPLFVTTAIWWYHLYKAGKQ